MIEYTAPGWISKLRSSTAFKPPNFFARPSTRSRLMPPPPLRCRGSSAATVGGRWQSRPVASLQGRGAADEAEQGPHLQDGDATRIRTHGAAGRLRPPPGSDPRLAPGPLFRPSAAPAPCSCRRLAQGHELLGYGRVNTEGGVELALGRAACKRHREALEDLAGIG